MWHLWFNCNFSKLRKYFCVQRKQKSMTFQLIRTIPLRPRGLFLDTLYILLLIILISKYLEHCYRVIHLHTHKHTHTHNIYIYIYIYIVIVVLNKYTTLNCILKYYRLYRHNVELYNYMYIFIKIYIIH